GPIVVSTIPADTKTGVPLTTSVTINFSVGINPSTLNTDSFKIKKGSEEIEGSITVMAGNLKAVFRPSRLLVDNSTYTVELLANIEDSFGNALSGGSFSISFSTVDTTPPPQPEAGKISLSIPDDNDAETKIKGTQGTAEPGTVVTAVNEYTGTTATVISEPDGSFALTLPAAKSDRVTLIIRDTAGNETKFYPGPFKSDDGTTVIGSEGGIVYGPEGLEVVVPKEAIPDGTEIRLDVFSVNEIARLQEISE
ncbi:MAG: Ig-like domain-containing protein, partial [bacterium]|nr:Ig-like domain-containing protein [bacterium]